MASFDVNIGAFILSLLLYLRLIHGLLNIEELNSVHYAIDILNKPVLSGQLASGSVMYLKSRYGQEYQCNLPEINLSGEETRSTDDPTVGSNENDIAELLRPLENAPCLIKMKDWWTYEFCYGKYIRQYHIEDNKKAGPEILLGLYESEYDWKNDSEYEMNNRNRLQRYHSQYYVNGSRCDVTGNLRKAEVRFLCEEGSGNYIARVDEPESCRYVLTIHTSHVCHHPFLRPAPSNKPQSVTCNPVLTSDQYEQYLFREEVTKAAEESRQKWLAKQEEQLEEMKKKIESEKDVQDEEKPVQEANESLLNDDSEESFDDENGVNFDTSSNDIIKNLNGKHTMTDEDMEDGADEPLPVQDSEDLQGTSKNEKINLAGLKDTGERNPKENFEDVADEPDEEPDTNLNEDEQLEQLGAAEEAKKVASAPGQHTIEILEERDIDQDQRQRLEQAIRQKLEQSGVDTKGKKIELKIVIAEYAGKENDDDSDGEFHISDDVSKKFLQHFIMTFYAKNQEAVQQMERQQRLEENYRFVWGENKKPKKDDDDNNDNNINE